MWLRAVGDKVIHSSWLRIINKMWNYRINEKKKSQQESSAYLNIADPRATVNNAARSVADFPQLRILHHWLPQPRQPAPR